MAVLFPHQDGLRIDDLRAAGLVVRIEASTRDKPVACPRLRCAVGSGAAQCGEALLAGVPELPGCPTHGCGHWTHSRPFLVDAARVGWGPRNAGSEGDLMSVGSEGEGNPVPSVGSGEEPSPASVDRVVAAFGPLPEATVSSPRSGKPREHEPQHFSCYRIREPAESTSHSPTAPRACGTPGLDGSESW